MLRIVCNIILVCVICISTSFILSWVLEAFFNLEPNFWGLSLVFMIFGLFLSIPFLTVGLAERGRNKGLRWFNQKLQRYEPRTRYTLRMFLTRLGVILVIGVILLVFLMQVADKEPWAYTLVPLFSGLFLGLLGASLISYNEISLIHPKKFRMDEEKRFKDLKLGLENYNRAVDFSLQRKKLYAIIQYVKHVYNLGLKEEKHRLETNLDKIIRALENENLSEIPKTLVKVFKNFDSFIKEYGDIGIEIRAPLWTRTKETMVSSFHKALPQLIWLLITIAIFLVLRMFIPIEISIP